MENYRFSETALYLNPERLDAAVGTETLVVTGASRGMTSLVSYSLFELGYFLGDTLQIHNFEDQDMLRALPDRTKFRRHLRHRKPFCELVEARNAARDRWGFKLPTAAPFVPEMTELLRNPVVILCVRNPIATCRSVMRRNPKVKGGLSAAYRNSKKWLAALDFLMESETVPSIILDMDRVQTAPAAFVEELAETLRLEGDLGAIAEKIVKPGYKATEGRAGVNFTRANGSPVTAAPAQDRSDPVSG